MSFAPTEFHTTSTPRDEVERLMRQWEAEDRKRGPAFLRERREKHEKFWAQAEGSLEAVHARLNDPRRHPAPASPSEFKFDAAAVLQAVTALAEHAVAGTISAEAKQAWARQHHALFRFPPAIKVADHVEQCAKLKSDVVGLVASVLGISRVEAALANTGDAQ